MIPLNDLNRAQDTDELLAAARSVLARGRYVRGVEHDAFEAQLATYLDVTHVRGVASGTDALELALRAVGVRAEGRVITAANAGCYARIALHAIGAEPLYADVDEESLTLDPASVEPLLPQADAVVVTHLYGRISPAIVDLGRLCHTWRIPLVEDCAQALGARIGNRMAGAFGDAAAFSFYPTKTLGALGDGGAVATRNSHTADNVQMLREYGWGGRYLVSMSGGRNSRLDELQAAFLRRRLPHLDERNERRRVIAARYAAALPAGLRLVGVDDESYVAHLAVLVTPDRDRLSARLQGCGIATDIHYPVPDHRQPSAPIASLPVTERTAAQILTVPCFPEMTEAEVERVVEALSVP